MLSFQLKLKLDQRFFSYNLSSSHAKVLWGMSFWSQVIQAWSSFHFYDYFFTKKHLDDTTVLFNGHILHENLPLSSGVCNWISLGSYIQSSGSSDFILDHVIRS